MMNEWNSSPNFLCYTWWNRSPIVSWTRIWFLTSGLSLFGKSALYNFTCYYFCYWLFVSKKNELEKSILTSKDWEMLEANTQGLRLTNTHMINKEPVFWRKTYTLLSLKKIEKQASCNKSLYIWILFLHYSCSL